MKQNVKLMVVAGLVFILATLGVSCFSGNLFAQEKTTIIWWVELTEQYQLDLIRKNWIEPFNASHPDILVKMESQGDYVRVVPAALAAGAGPDILDTYGPSDSLQYAKAGATLPLDKYSTEYGWDKVLFKWAMDVCRYKGVLYSIPAAYEAFMLWYNADMFVDYGWKLPKNWDEVVSTCEKIQAQGIIPFIFGASVPEMYQFWVNYAFDAGAGAENVYRALTGQMPWTDSAFIEAIERTKFMWEQGWISNRNESGLTLPGVWAMFGEQKAAMNVEGTWLLQNIDQYVKDFTWSFSILPTLRNGVKPGYCTGIGENIAINNDCKFPDEAAQFLNFMISDPKKIAEVMVSRGAFWIPRAVSFDDFPEGVDTRHIRVVETLSAALEAGNYGYLTWTYWGPKTVEHLWRYLPSVWRGEMTAADYMARTQKLYEEEMEEGTYPPVPPRGK